MNLMNRFTFIVYLGAAILGYTAGEMLMEDKSLAGYAEHFAAWIEYVFPVFLGLLVIFIGSVIQKKRYLAHVSQKQ